MAGCRKLRSCSLRTRTMRRKLVRTCSSRRSRTRSSWLRRRSPSRLLVATCLLQSCPIKYASKQLSEHSLEVLVVVCMFVLDSKYTWKRAHRVHLLVLWSLLPDLTSQWLTLRDAPRSISGVLATEQYRSIQRSFCYGDQGPGSWVTVAINPWTCASTSNINTTSKAHGVGSHFLSGLLLRSLH